MTLEAARALAMRIMSINGVFVRVFAHFNYPAREPWLVAIAVAEYRNGRLEQVEFAPLLGCGYALDALDGIPTYTIARTNEDGSPFRPEPR